MLENVTKFKDYNSAPYVMHSLGIKGLNSSILGSQIAERYHCYL